MSTPCRLIEFGTDHIPRALALWRQTAGVGLSAADEPAALAAYLARNPGSSFVLFEADVLVGTILCGHDGRRGLIHHLVIAPGQRRRGLARLLVHRSLEALRSAGIDKCHLLVFQANHAGLAFWRALGARERVELALFSVATDDAA